MGYFEALTSSAFKTTADGRRLFFPWGVLARGYELASEQDYERLRRQVKAYMIVSLVLVIGLGVLGAHLLAGIVVVLLLVSYVVWVQFVLRGLRPSEERLSMHESMTTQAVTHSAGMLWAMLVVSLLFVAGGLVILAVDPGEWFLALASTLLFGACAIMVARMLFLRSRQSSS
jgi:hypothetical protein